MKEATHKKLHILVSTLIITGAILLASLGSILHTSGSNRFFTGSAEDYYQSLITAGFPQDYAISLTELHLLHPSWEFRPLKITEQKSQYSWNYVIDKETEEDDNNLVSSGTAYAPYRHPTNDTLYDAGHYQASRETVEYFMDPRNFLNETDIFQFLDLSVTVTDPLHAVEQVLAGTFMENATLENGMTYAAYFCVAGAEIGINPVFIATKARQEQGVNGTSPIISGTCGSLLADYYTNQTQFSSTGKEIRPPTTGHTEEALKALDGYYNLYNIGASGNGLFSIYYNAMLRAQSGTDAKAADWGNNPSWNTRWKALYGGASFLKSSYIDAYQSTLYLQKFNVDSRAEGKNFWKQYSQSVSAALSEARTLYSAMAAGGTLDNTQVFLIPIYGNMPDDPCADPAAGTCSYTAQATTKYEYETSLTMPVWHSSENAPIYRSIEAVYGEPLKLKGTFSHSYGVKGIEYRLDDGEWIPIEGNSLNVSVETDFPQDSQHILTVRGIASYDHEVSSKKNNQYFLCAVFYLSAVQPDVTLSLEIGNTVTDRIYKAGTFVTLPHSDAPDFAGWLGSDQSFLPSGAEFLIRKDITYSAIFLEFEVVKEASLYTASTVPHLRFYAKIADRDYRLLANLPGNAIRLYGTVTHDGSATVCDVALIPTSGNPHLTLAINSPNIPPSSYQTGYSPSFFAELQYTDGTQTTLKASGETSRTAVQIAQAALADTAVRYPNAVVQQFQNILDSAES